MCSARNARIPEALRKALESLKGIAAARGIDTSSPIDHTGRHASALLSGRYDKGRWTLRN